ncbi:MAG: aminotransferase class I/II-fold pyridoxal phosphate-dependent enzyme [Clostridia bacterium]
MEAPLYNLIASYATENRFHTPGHSGANVDNLLFKSANMDITELSFSDNLHGSRGVILQAEKLLANAFKTKFSLMLTTGATCGIQMAVFVCEGDIATFTLNHKSFYNAMQLFNKKVVAFDSLEQLLNCKNKTFSAVFVTRPNYFGEVFELEALSKFCKKNGVLLIVDEAHGSHFVFSNLLPTSANLFADIVINSLHKTLPVLTGGACVNCNSQDIYQNLANARNLIHTTSPNYMIMASIDFARAYIVDNAKIYKNILDFVTTLKAQYSAEYFSIIETADFTRFVIDTKEYDANKIVSELEAQNFFVEMNTDSKIVLILTPFNYTKAEAFLRALAQIKPQKTVSKQAVLQAKKGSLNGKKQFVNLEDCLGCVTLAPLGVYPPGVPIVEYGDIIDKEILQYLLKNKNKLFGLVNDKVCVLK